MTCGEPATIVVFRWNEEPPPLLPSGHPGRISGDDGEELTYQAARPAATALFAALQRGGYAATDATLSHGEFGWHFDVSNAGQTYSLFVHWTGIENADYLAIQPRLRRRWFAALFRSRPSSDTLVPVKPMLSSVLDALPSVSSVQWLTQSQFTRAYCRGERLPTNERHA